MPSSTRNSTWSLTVEGLAALPSDGTLLSARGKYTSIDVPSTDRGVICTVPPDCLATPSTMLRPRPDPLPISLVVKKGSNFWKPLRHSRPRHSWQSARSGHVSASVSPRHHRTA
jgi:hypothetical protein